MKKLNFKFWAARTLCVTALFGSLFVSPAHADLALPVAVGMGSTDALRQGEPVTVHVVVQPGVDLAIANFRLEASKSWMILDGASFWSGSLKAGENLAFAFRAVPLTDNPEPLRGYLDAPGNGHRLAMLDPQHLGGKFPEHVIGEPGSASEAGPIFAEFESGVALPEPAAASRPRLPGQPAEEPRTPIKSNLKSRRAAEVSVSATGQFTYLDDNNVRHGVRNATVQLVNAKVGNDLVEDICATGTTDANGNFTLGDSSCGDLFDGPDVQVRIVLNNNRVEVRPDGLFTSSYTFQTNIVANAAAGLRNFGQITIGSNQRAFQTHNIIMRAQQFMASLGENMPKVHVLWPSNDGKTYYVPVLGDIHVESLTPFAEEGDIFHEYGHHVLHSKVESPIPDYSNGFCDGDATLPFEGGHCLWSPEKGLISWTEGWPDFFAMFLLRQHDAADNYVLTGKYNFESDQVAEGFEGMENKIEGVIAGILCDVVDNADENGEIDRVDLTFTDTWNIVKNFDPSSDILHNHPTSIEEFWSGVRQFNLGVINDISQVYRQHKIIMPEPDLQMTALQNPPTILDRGAQFSVNNTVRNTGNERANDSFFVRFTFRNVNTTGFFTAGLRGVGQNLLAGSSNADTTSLTIPATATPGVYRLRVCADTPNRVPETAEDNNCRDATVTTEIR